MNTIKKYIRGALCLLLISALLVAVTGCLSATIREDAVQENLPVIDPEDGVARSIAVTCYYRLLGEDCLVGIERQVDVRAGERAELAIIRELIAGVPEGSTGVGSPFPEGTEVTEAELDGTLLNVTLSSAFLSERTYDVAEYEANTALSSGELTKEEYDARLAEALTELHMTRRLAAYSIVNTITGYSSGVTVQLMTGSGGKAARITLGDMGLNENFMAESEPLSALSFDEKYLAKPRLVMEYFLAHIAAGEYEQAYRLIADKGADGSSRPTYATFEKAVLSAGTLLNFEVTDTGVGVHISLTFGAGTYGYDVMMMVEDGIPKVSYASFEEGLVTAK